MQSLRGKHQKSLRAGRLLALALVAGALLRPTAAPAQMSQMSACPAGNLLAGRPPVEWRGIRGDKLLATDGKKAPEGAMWNAPAVATVLDDPAAELTYDLGAVVPLQALYVQADANDVYHLWSSLDGREFRPIAEVGIAEGVHGLRSRKLSLGGIPTRFLRIGEGVGDNAYSVSEIQAFCQLPTPFPPNIPEVAAPPAQVATNFFTYWNNESSAFWEFLLAIIGLMLLYVDFDDRRSEKPRFTKKVRDRALMVLGALSLLTYFNFGFFHFPNWVHDWEWTHYYVGSKYFKELSYDRLYECIAIADHESPDLGLQRRAEIRKVTNLGGHNELETTKEILAHPERCKQHFSEARWESFTHDVKFFRDRQNNRRWDDLQTDHGYNATPVWNIAGSLLANLAPASEGQLYTLALLDPLYFLAMVALVWWAFGWRTTCVGLLVFATNFPSRYYWTGGSFLRWDWLFYLVAGVCLLKKERPLLAGLALGYSTLLRVFPGFIFVGPLLAGVIELARYRRWNQSYLKLAAGALLSVVLLVPISLKVGGGTQAYTAFIKNTQKHKETALTNYMGLRTIVAYRPGEAGRDLKNEHDTDPWGKWKQARVRAFQQAKPVYALLALGYLVLLGFAVRNRAPWQAAALGATFIAIAPVELTCYYYAFVMAVVVLHEEDERVGRIMLMMTAATVFIFFHWLSFMPSWLDEQYTLMSVVTVAAFVAILWNFGLGPWLAARRAARVAASPAGAAAPVLAANTEAAKGEPAKSSEEERPSRQPPAKKRKRR
jgi:hypothetical protein